MIREMDIHVYKVHRTKDDDMVGYDVSVGVNGETA